MKKLAIIGASYLQLPLIKKAKEMGLETHCFAWEEGAVCKELADFFYPISILQKETILEKCIEININGIVSIASDAAVPTVCYIAEKLNLISNKYEETLACTNKYEMRKLFFKNQVACPKFTYATSNFDVSDFTFPLIIKPVDRSGSRGVTKVNSEFELFDAIERAKKESFTKQVIIEEFISGSEVSVETISWEGKHYILAITDKVTTGEPYFVELAHHQPSQLNEKILKQIKKETIKSLNALNIKYGASHAEFKITSSDKVYAIETGARMGGDFIGSDLVRLSTGYDFVKAVIEVALGSFTIPFKSISKYSGVYFISKETENLLNVIHSKENFNWVVESSIHDEQLIEIQCSADRSGYIIYQAEQKIIL